MKSLGLLLMLVGVSGPLVLRDQAPVAKGVAAMPRVESGVAPAVAAKMNEAFGKLDARVGAAAADCRRDYLAQQHKRNDEAWQRGVEVTMRGPRYLSVVATDSYFCGGAYPNDGLLLPLVYDLKTGGAVNWLKLLPAGAKSGIDTAADGSTVGAVIWPVLTRKAREQVSAECQEAYGDEVSFVLWLDARSGAVMAEASSLPHAEAACAEAVSISVEEGRKLGLDRELMEAVEAAQRLQR